MLDIVMIAGSPSATSRSTAVLSFLNRQFSARGLRTATLAVRDLPAEDLVYGRYDSPAIHEASALIQQACVLVIATPVFKASYSGLLKSFLDLLPQSAFAGKTLLPIATAGSPLHMLAIDYALRPVLSTMGANHILQGVYIEDNQIQFEQDRMIFATPIQERLDNAIHSLVNVVGANEIALQYA